MSGKSTAPSISCLEVRVPPSLCFTCTTYVCAVTSMQGITFRLREQSGYLFGSDVIEHEKCLAASTDSFTDGSSCCKFF